jgi:hypothetical protein
MAVEWRVEVTIEGRFDIDFAFASSRRNGRTFLSSHILIQERAQFEQIDWSQNHLLKTLLKTDRSKKGLIWQAF